MGSDFNRRDLIKRATAAGLIAVPTATFLTSCASGGDDGEDKVDKGTKSKDNPLAMNETAEVDVVIFDGGFGDDWAKDAEKSFQKLHPKAGVKHTGLVDIRGKLQPRFNGGSPPDLIDNSGAGQMDLGTLVAKQQVVDFTPMLDAPSIDDPNKKVRDTLRPGVLEMGQFDGEQVWVLYYAYTVYGVWYSQSTLDKYGWEYPQTWDAMLTLCAEAKKEGIAGWTYAGKHPYYIPFTMYPMMAKVGGREVLDAIDNLEPNAWKHPAVKAVIEAYYELAAKDYILKGTPGIDHIQSQTKWTQGKALFIPNGSWVENEARKTTPKDFQMAVGAPQGLDSSDKMPYGTIWASGGEPFIVPSKAKNPEGGMELMRVMLSEASSRNFIQKISSLTSFNGGTEGVTLPSGLASANKLLDAAGENIVNPRLQDWYVPLQKEKIGVAALGEMMAGRLKPDECIKKIQKFADDTAKDDSVKKYKHR